MVDPSWSKNEPHFNLLSMDVARQKLMKVGDVIHVRVNQNERTIQFYVNDEFSKPFATGDWAKLNYEPVYAYAILTTKNDVLTIVS